jgi:hypothetical protein
VPLQGLHDTPTLQLPQVDFMILTTTDDPRPALGGVETRADAVDVVLPAFVCFHASVTRYVSGACPGEVITADREVA